MCRIKFLAVLSVLTLCLLPSTASADGPGAAAALVRRDARMHEGLFLRMSAGGGIGGTYYEDVRPSGTRGHTQTIGAAVMTEVAVGWTVFENLVLHSTLHLTHLDERKSKGRNRESSDDVSTYFQAPLQMNGVKSTYRGQNVGLAFTTTFN